MTVIELLSSLRNKGVKLWVEGGQLRYSAPSGALTSEWILLLKNRKLEILTFLNDASESATSALSSANPALQEQGSDDYFARHWSALLKLQSGGKKRPIFLVHPVGGGIGCYLKLAKCLGESQPVYAFTAMHKSAKNYPSMEDMAQDYAAQIFTIDPTGPYMLGGYSFGGLVVFEMAQLLKRMGKEVPLLAIIDTLSPTLWRTEPAQFPPPPDYDDEAGTLDIAHLLSGQPRERFDGWLKNTDHLNVNQKIQKVFEELVKAGVIPDHLKIEEVHKVLEGHRQRVKLSKLYQTQIYDGKITLFKAIGLRPESEEPTCSSHPTLGWSNLSTKPIKVYEIPGDHETMLEEPNVRILAKDLKRSIRESIAKGGVKE